MLRIFTIISFLTSLNVSAQSWHEMQKVVASDRDQGDWFGHSVSISGNCAIVSALLEDEDTLGLNTLSYAGSAYVYELDSNGKWVEAQKLVASDRDIDDWFGYSVAISGDYAIAGAPEEDEDTSGINSINAAGSSYIFKRNTGGQWTEVQKIVASDRLATSYFGRSVAISRDRLIVGAPGFRWAYIFERDSIGMWTEVQKLIPSDFNVFQFGASVSIDSNYVIVGARAEAEDELGGNTMNNAGAAYIFERDTNGIWMEVQKIVASDRDVNAYFGHSVGVSGNYVVSGAMGETKDALGGNSLLDAGAAYIFERDSLGTWMETHKLVSNDRQAGDSFGHSVSIANSKAVVSAFLESENALGGNTLSGAGSAYVFERDSLGIWTQKQKIVASDRRYNDWFGWSVYISGDYIISGALYEDEDAFGGNTMTGAGSAYIFYYGICVNKFVQIDTSIINGDSVFVGGAYQTTLGTYYDTISITGGCDSVVQTNLTVLSGIENFVNFYGVRTYPNPFTHDITFDIRTPQTEDGTIQIVSVTGQVVYNQAFTSNTPFTVQEDFTEGLYFAQIRVGEQVEVVKVVKQ